MYCLRRNGLYLSVHGTWGNKINARHMTLDVAQIFQEELSKLYGNIELVGV